MKFVVLVLSTLGAVLARPDVSHLNGGYNYNSPGGGFNNFGASSNSISGSYLPGSSGSSILGGSVDGSFGISGGNIGIGGGNIGGGYNQQHQDQKHVYFYAAPDDEQPARLRINVAASNHKNTKIIFIKAPSAGGVIPEVIAPPSSAEDKTLVYVLVKKQEQGGAITIPSSLGVKQAKPEVYFIKYRNQQEAEQAVQSGLSGQSVGSGLSDLGNEQSFVRTIKDNVNQGGFGGISGGGIGGGIGGGDFSGGSSILGASVSGGSIDGGSGGISGSIGGGSVSAQYGTPGASGPY